MHHTMTSHWIILPLTIGAMIYVVNLTGRLARSLPTHSAFRVLERQTIHLLIALALLGFWSISVSWMFLNFALSFLSIAILYNYFLFTAEFDDSWLSPRARIIFSSALLALTSLLIWLEWNAAEIIILTAMLIVGRFVRINVNAMSQLFTDYSMIRERYLSNQATSSWHRSESREKKAA